MTLVVNGERTPLTSLPFEFSHADVVDAAFFDLAIAPDLAPREPLAAGEYAPQTTDYTLEPDEVGVIVYALQRALNATMAHRENWITVDRVYGRETEDAVRAFQERKRLKVDGVFGPASSRSMAAALEFKIKGVTVPAGLPRGLVEGESGGLIGAVNSMVAGGRDLSYCQRRVYAADYGNVDVVSRAVDPRYQFNLFARRLRERKDVYRARPAVRSDEWAWRCSTLNHNYPALAERITTDGIAGLSSYYTSPQAWVDAIGARMDDGTPVRTPLGWGKFYSLGAPEFAHVGRMVEYVERWIP